MIANGSNSNRLPLVELYLTKPFQRRMYRRPRKCSDFRRLHNAAVNEGARKFQQGEDEGKPLRNGMRDAAGMGAALARQINPMGLGGQAARPSEAYASRPRPYFESQSVVEKGPDQSLLRSKKREGDLEGCWTCPEGRGEGESVLMY